MGSPAPHPVPSLTRSLREHGIQCHERVWVTGHVTLDKFLSILRPVSHHTNEGDNGFHPAGFCEHKMTRQVGTRDCCCVVTRCLMQGALLGAHLRCAEVLRQESGLSEETDLERGGTGHLCVLLPVPASPGRLGLCCSSPAACQCQPPAQGPRSSSSVLSSSVGLLV